MNFCSQCGAPVVISIPPGDTLPRHICERCGAIHYRNPKLVVGCIPQWQEKILLCRRAIEPRHGLWTLPAGFMENGETAEQAAIRETMEEACAEVELDDLFSLISLPRISQVHLFYLGRMNAPVYAVGSESLEVELFAEEQIPWDTLAFSSVEVSLRAYFKDRRSGMLGQRPPVSFAF
ncbi:MAG: NUDIX hydrolase [Betaproteobacteria bacterium]|nr:NUDIX hydrolase [Betaproteobacteria bacterium]